MKTSCSILCLTVFVSAALFAAPPQDDLRTMLDKAKAETAKKNFVSAYELLRKCIKLSPNNASIHLQLGDTYLANDSTDQAIVAYSRAKEIEPTSARAYEGLGDCYDKEGATMVAITQYQKVVELDSLRAEPFHKLAHMNMKLRRYNDAAQAYRTVIRLDSTDGEALLELGKLYLAAKQWGNAAKTMLVYTERMPDSTIGWQLSMEAATNARLFSQALDAADHLMKKNIRTPAVFRSRGKALSELGKCQEALTSYNDLSRVDTLTADDFYRMAKCNSELKKDSLAAAYFEKSLAKDTTQGDVWGEVGALYMRLRKFDKAADAFQRRYKLEPNSTASYVNYALSSMALERWSDAIVALRIAETLNPEFLLIPLNIGRCLVRMDSLLASVPYYERVLTLGKENGNSKYKSEFAEAWSILGLQYLIQKNYSKAIDALSSSIKFKDDVAQTHLWLGQAYALSGKRDEAIKEYRKCLKIDPRNKDAHKGLELLGEE